MIIRPLFDSIETKHLKEVNEYISDLYFDYENEKYCELMLKETHYLFPNIPLLYDEDLTYEVYSDFYKNREIVSPYNNYKNDIGYKETIKFDRYNILLFSIKSNINLQEDFESYYQPKEIKTINYKFLSAEELKNLVYTNNEYKIPLVEDCGKSSFMGFHYFKPQDILSYHQPKNLRFVVCIVNDVDVVGILKVADYELTADTDYLGLNYIDVHKGYRRLGIAKGLYNKLNDSYNKETILISSDLSEEGRKAKLNELRKSIITNFKTYDSINDYYEEVYTNK